MEMPTAELSGAGLAARSRATRGAGARVSKQTAVAALALVLVTGFAWLRVVRGAQTMEGGMPMDGWDLGALAPYVWAWTVMMAAMMIPSAAPFFLLYRRGARSVLATLLLVAGYLAVWAGFGVVAWIVERATVDVSHRWLATSVLIAAAVYQVSPLKNACLRACRNPASFLMTHWHPGRLGALRLGLEHGAYCLGCCIALMLVLVVAAAMGLVWVATLALVVFAEKVLPRSEWTVRAIAVALLGLGIGTAMVPGLAGALQI